MIPQEKTAAVGRALRETFGVTEFEDIRQITKGHTTALVFRIIVQGRPYLLRIIMRTQSMIGPERQFTCMKRAADAGVAPRVWFASEADQISISDFVEEKPFPAAEALVRIPAVLRTLHALASFPRGVSQFDTTCMFLLHNTAATEAFIGRFRAAHLQQGGEREEILARLAEMATVYRRHEDDMVSSHNDLFKPDNILFDGYRVWLVDWEAAFLNDRYADLAVVANLIVADEAGERIYLEQYFGQAPDETQLARFFLMRQLTHIFYAMAFLYLASDSQPVDFSDHVPEFNAVQQKMWAGEINVADASAKVVYGRAHWKEVLKNVQTARYREALRIVSAEQ